MPNMTKKPVLAVIDDFLDNSNGNKDIISLRSMKRLELSLSSGFPAFLTSHGYEIDKHVNTLKKMRFFDKIYRWKETYFPDAKFAKLSASSILNPERYCLLLRSLPKKLMSSYIAGY